MKKKKLVCFDTPEIGCLPDGDLYRLWACHVPQRPRLRGVCQFGACGGGVGAVLLQVAVTGDVCHSGSMGTVRMGSATMGIDWRIETDEKKRNV